MKQAFKTVLSEAELRKLIREELKAVLNGESDQIAGGDDAGFIDIEQAATFIKLSKNTLYQMIHKKEVPHHKTGRRVMFKKTELSDWLLKRTDRRDVK